MNTNASSRRRGAFNHMPKNSSTTASGKTAASPSVDARAGAASDATSAKKEAAATGSALTQSDYERLSDFRHALREFLAFSQQAAKEVGLTPQQHQSLLSIKGAQARGGMSVGGLSRRMLLRHHSAVELVDRLVEAGLVKREASMEDARKVMLRLTRRAEALLTRLSAVHLEELRRVGPQLKGLIEEVSHREEP